MVQSTFSVLVSLVDGPGMLDRGERDLPRLLEVGGGRLDTAERDLPRLANTLLLP